LWGFTEDQRGRAVFVMVLAAVSAAAPVVGWTIVGDVIDNGIRAGDTTRLSIDVALYIGVNAIAWGLGTATWLMLAAVPPAATN
jgi:hypothetical protein